MKKFACILMVLMLVITGILPAFATGSAVCKETVSETYGMSRISYEGPITTYVEHISVSPAIIEGSYVMFNYPKLTVSVGATNDENSTVNTTYITIRINRYLPGGTYVPILTNTVPVDGSAHNVVVGLAISTSAIYMVSYSIPAYTGARVNVVMCAHSYNT